jgi:hypothetical protein
MELEPSEQAFLQTLRRLAIYFPLGVMAVIAAGCFLADYIFWQY